MMAEIQMEIQKLHTMTSQKESMLPSIVRSVFVVARWVPRSDCDATPASLGPTLLACLTRFG